MYILWELVQQCLQSQRKFHLHLISYHINTFIGIIFKKKEKKFMRMKVSWHDYHLSMNHKIKDLVMKL